MWKRISIFLIDCGTQIIRGGLKQQDIFQGGQVTITCSNGGCLHFTKVISNEHPRPHYNMLSHQAIFGCNNDQTIERPNAAQLEFIKEKCEGKEVCTAEACDSWWNTDLRCPSREQPIMKLSWHCHGVPGPREDLEIRNGGRCEAGVYYVKIMVSL